MKEKKITTKIKLNSFAHIIRLGISAKSKITHSCSDEINKSIGLMEYYK